MSIMGLRDVGEVLVDGVTGLDYSGLTGVLSLTSGYTIPTSGSYLLADGSVDLTGDWTISANSITLTGGTVQASYLTAMTQLHLRDVTSGFFLKIQAEIAGYADDETLYIDIADEDKTLIISGDATISQDYSVTGSPAFANITDSGLTITRVPYASTAGLLIDSANLTFDGTTLTAGGFITTGIGRFDGGLGMNATASLANYLYVNRTLADGSTNAQLLYLTAQPTANGYKYTGLNFIVYGTGSTYDIAEMGGVWGYVGSISGYSGTIAKAYSIGAKVSVVGAARGGQPTATDAYLFYGDSVVATNATITNAYGLYLPAITAGSTLNYAIYSAGGLSYHAGQWLAGDKILFTQTDGNEYIDSLADGYLDEEATTGIRWRINTAEQINLTDGVLSPTTDNDIDLGTSSVGFKNTYLTGFLSLQQKAGTTADGDLWNDSTQEALQTFVSGIEQTLVGVIFTQTADQTIANTTTETTMFGTGVGTLTLPANFWVVGKTIRVEIHGDFADTGNPTAEVQAYYGATSLIDSGAITLSGLGGTEEWKCEVIITCRSIGGTGTVQTVIDWEYETTTGSSAIERLDVEGAVQTIDTTASGALDVTFQWGTAAAANTLHSHVAFVEVLN